MLDDKTKKKVKAKIYPKAEQTIFGPVTKALEQYLQPGARVLDAGCGNGSWILRNYRQRISFLVSVDIQASKEGNRKMGEFVLSDLDDIPFLDATFDVVICNDVIEHLRHPQRAFAEFWRVLTDGGIFIFQTPCIISPLFFLSRYSSFRWHKTIKRLITGTQISGVFPTYYRCNTRRELGHSLRAIGFRKETLESVEDMHDYLVFNIVTYGTGLLFSRLMQILPLAEPFRSQLIGVYRKVQASDETLKESYGIT